VASAGQPQPSKYRSTAQAGNLSNEVE
jgi:hypothetical protein